MKKLTILLTVLFLFLLPINAKLTATIDTLIHNTHVGGADGQAKITWGGDFWNPINLKLTNLTTNQILYDIWPSHLFSGMYIETFTDLTSSDYQFYVMDGKFPYPYTAIVNFTINGPDLCVIKDDGRNILVENNFNKVEIYSLTGQLLYIIPKYEYQDFLFNKEQLSFINYNMFVFVFYMEDGSVISEKLNIQL